MTYQILLPAILSVFMAAWADPAEVVSITKKVSDNAKRQMKALEGALCL